MQSMDAPASSQRQLLEEHFLAQILTHFSDRLAALERERELTVLHPTWRAQCGRAGCGWEGSETNKYAEAQSSASIHAATVHMGDISGIVVLKGS